MITVVNRSLYSLFLSFFIIIGNSAFSLEHSGNLHLGQALMGTLTMESPIGVSSTSLLTDYTLKFEDFTFKKYGLKLKLGTVSVGPYSVMDNISYNSNNVDKVGSNLSTGAIASRFRQYGKWKEEIGVAFFPFSFLKIDSLSVGKINDLELVHSSSFSLLSFFGLELNYHLYRFHEWWKFKGVRKLKYGFLVSYRNHWFHKMEEAANNSQGQSIAKVSEVSYSLSLFVIALSGGIVF